MIALMVLLFTGALNTPIAFLSNILSKFIFLFQILYSVKEDLCSR